MDEKPDSARVVFVGTYRIPAGRAGAWRAANREVTEFVAAAEPRVISFDSYLNADETEATTIQVHPDSASLETHLDLAASRIGLGVQVVEVLRIDLYGAPSDAVVDRLRRMATWPVTIKRHVHGFARDRGG